MMKNKKDILRAVIDGSARAAFVTFLAFLLSFFMLEPLSFSVFSILSSPEKSDFAITDLYAQVADRRPVRTIDPDIILVDIGHAGREEIAQIIEDVNFWQPKVIGIDILFAGENPADSALMSALYGAESVIVPVVLDEDEPGQFHIAETPFFFPDGKMEYAAVNLPSKYDGGVIREFATSFDITDEGCIPSFPMAVAKAYGSKSLDILSERNNMHEAIDYPSRDFVTLTIDDIEADGSMLTGRIVLIGAMYDGADFHSTPVNRYMSGMHIHAMSIATILGGKFYNRASRFPAWVPASLLCFLILLVRNLTKARLTGLVTRLLQIFIVYYAVRIGYHLYVDEHRIFDFSYTMLMVSFGFLAGDLWTGTVYIAQNVRRIVMGLIKKVNKSSDSNKSSDK